MPTTTIALNTTSSVTIPIGQTLMITGIGLVQYGPDFPGRGTQGIDRRATIGPFDRLVTLQLTASQTALSWYTYPGPLDSNGNQPVAADPGTSALTGAGAEAVNNSVSRKALSVGTMGDSITKQGSDFPAGYGGAAGDTAYSNFGYQAWWLFHSGAEMAFTFYATSGFTSQQVVETYLSQAISAKHDVYTYFAGINDAGLTGAQTVGYAQQVASAVLGIGKKLVLIAPSPNGADFTSSATRFSIIWAGLRAIAAANPGQIRFVDAYSLFSDQGFTDGRSYTSVFDQLQYDAGTPTHPTASGAAMIGKALDDATKDWTAPFVFDGKNGLSVNLLANPGLGGTAGSIANAATNSAAPTSWTVARSGSNVTYGAYKARTTPLRWITATTYPVGARIKPAQRNGCHYIVLTSATTGVTIPSSTTQWATTTPDVGGPVYMVVPENDFTTTPRPREELLFDASCSVASPGASDYCYLRQDITVSSYVGRSMRVGTFIEHLDSDIYGYHIRVTQQLTAGGTKVVEHFAMGLNSFLGSNQAPTLVPFTKARGLVMAPDFVVQPTTTNVRMELRVFPRGNSVPMRIAVSEPFAYLL